MPLTSMPTLHPPFKKSGYGPALEGAGIASYNYWLTCFVLGASDSHKMQNISTV